MGFMNKEQARAAISSLTLWDDRFFSKCLDGSAECASLMLSVILGRDDLEVESARTQEWKQSIDGRSVRFDIAARGSDGSLYDIEIQKAEEGAGSRRARYYSSMMDADALDKDTGFEELPETFVIFITPGDAIGGGKPLYGGGDREEVRRRVAHRICQLIACGEGHEAGDADARPCVRGPEGDALQGAQGQGELFQGDQGGNNGYGERV